MKHFKLYVLVLFVCITGIAAKDQLEMPAVKKISVSNNLNAFYIKDNLPQLTITAVIGYGKLYETAANAGLSRLVSQMLKNGGSRKYPGGILHKSIEDIGGKLSISTGYEHFVIQIKVLSKFKDTAFTILNSLLTEPVFKAKNLYSAKLLVTSRIKRTNDNPAQVAFIKARKIIFNGNSYGAEATVKKVNSFALQQVKDLWNKIVVTKNIYIGIATSIPFETIQTSCEIFKSIPQRDKILYSIDTAAIKQKLQTTKGKIYFYKKDIPQATVVMGTIAPNVVSKDIYNLAIMNYILGGGSFNSWLMKEIRVKRGLAYSTGSVIRSRLQTGIFLAYAQTNARSVATVIKIMNSNLKKMQTKGVTSEELAWAKNAIINSYVFNFDSTAALLSNVIDLKYNSLPDDYYDDYLKNIKKVARKEVLRASRDLFGNPVVIMVVGPEGCKQKLKKLAAIVDLN